MSSPPRSPPLTSAELTQCTALLEKLHSLDTRALSFYEGPVCRALRKAVAPFAKHMHRKMFDGVSRGEYEAKRKLWREEDARKAQQKSLDAKHVNLTQMRRGRLERLAQLQKAQGGDVPMVADGAVEAPTALLALQAEKVQLNRPRACYTCKKRYYELHHFYATMCPSCAALNYAKRSASCSLQGRVCLVTGGRVKIGFQIVLKLLRWGAAKVIVTTRFPRDCARRFAEQARKEGAEWDSRVDIYGLDFRHVGLVESFCAHMSSRYERLDCIVNNACQTIRRPAAFYQGLLEGEGGGKGRRRRRCSEGLRILLLLGVVG